MSFQNFEKPSNIKFLFSLSRDKITVSLLLYLFLSFKNLLKSLENVALWNILILGGNVACFLWPNFLLSSITWLFWKKEIYNKKVGLIRDEFAFRCLRLIFEYDRTSSLIGSFKMPKNICDRVLLFIKTDTLPETYQFL